MKTVRALFHFVRGLLVFAMLAVPAYADIITIIDTESGYQFSVNQTSTRPIGIVSSGLRSGALSVDAGTSGFIIGTTLSMYYAISEPDGQHISDTLIFDLNCCRFDGIDNVPYGYFLYFDLPLAPPFEVPSGLCSDSPAGTCRASEDGNLYTLGQVQWSNFDVDTIQYQFVGPHEASEPPLLFLLSIGLLGLIARRKCGVSPSTARR